MSKSIRRILMILIFIILFSTSNVYGLTKTELKNIDLTRIKIYSLENSYRNVQGGTITDKYILLAEIYDDNEKSALVVIDKNTYKKIKVITDYSFYHANDMTYNSNTNKVIITGGAGTPRLYILDGETLKQEEIVITKRGYSSIAFDKENNIYIARRKQKAYILDLKFEEQESFDISSEDLTAQGFEINNGKLYYTCFEAGRVTNYQKKYSEILKANENIIIVYDLKTKEKEKVYYIPQVTNEGIYPGELEGISFINNTPVIWTNKKGYINVFTPIAEKQNKTVEVKINEEIEDEKILLKLYKDKKLVNKVYNKDGKFTFKNDSSQKEDTTIYDVKYESDDYKIINDTLKVTSSYDFYKNELNVTTEDQFEIEKVEKTEIENKESSNEAEIKEDTKKEEKEEKKEETKEKSKKQNTKETKKTKNKNKKTKSKKVEDKKQEPTKDENNKAIPEIENNDNKNEIINENEDNNEVQVYETKEDDINNVEVPDTNTKDDINIIGIAIILLSLIVIKIKERQSK